MAQAFHGSCLNPQSFKNHSVMICSQISTWKTEVVCSKPQSNELHTWSLIYYGLRTLFNNKHNVLTSASSVLSVRLSVLMFAAVSVKKSAVGWGVWGPTQGERPHAGSPIMLTPPTQWPMNTELSAETGHTELFLLLNHWSRTNGKKYPHMTWKQRSLVRHI